MSLSKRRKVDKECRIFKEKWTTSYLFTEMHGKPSCLVCLQQVSVLKEYNIRRHYETHHSEKYDGLQGQLRRDKINELLAGLRKQQSTFIQSREVSEAAPRILLSTGPQQEHQTLYEFRTYSIRPDQNAAFLKLTNEKIHLRTAHSELVGYWSVEYGGLNEVVHIWKYDSYSQRTAVRAALAQDPSWISEYISKAMPMLTSQDNEVSYLVPWSHLQKPPQEGGVYELVSFQMRPGGPAVWGKDFQAAVIAHDAPGYGKLMGAFHNEFGMLNKVHALWWYESADQRAELRHRAHTDARVVAAVRNSVVHLESQESKLMYPCLFSPLK